MSSGTRKLQIQLARKRTEKRAAQLFEEITGTRPSLTKQDLRELRRDFIKPPKQPRGKTEMNATAPKEKPKCVWCLLPCEPVKLGWCSECAPLEEDRVKRKLADMTPELEARHNLGER